MRIESDYITENVSLVGPIVVALGGTSNFSSEPSEVNDKVCADALSEAHNALHDFYTYFLRNDSQGSW